MLVVVLLLLWICLLACLIACLGYHDCNGISDQRGVRGEISSAEINSKRETQNRIYVKVAWTGLVLSGKGFNKQTPSCRCRRV